MEKKIKVLFRDERNKDAEVIELVAGENFLDSLYKTIGCDYVELHYITLGKKRYCIWMDEEYKINHRNDEMVETFVLDTPIEPTIVYGSWVITKEDASGDPASLTKTEIERLTALTKKVNTWLEYRRAWLKEKRG